MPIYEYRCAKCGDFEVTQKITDSPLTRCPTCRGKVKKLISQTSFQLKGTGWYLTDYARKDRGTSAEKADKAAQGDGKVESKKDGKSASAESGAKGTKETAATTGTG
ncbi:MAG TPA: zinc ribbon domain-containing protein [Candidatus Acidoferrales bacterium]|nr:zinc ribbon domain-containing protein [Candidatus Acidoferrales bacterium]